MNYPQLWRTTGTAIFLLSVALTVPSTQAAGHTVRSGDTFTSIARKYKVSIATLQKANPKVKPGVITSGQVINLPATAAIKPATKSAPAGVPKSPKAEVAKAKPVTAAKPQKPAPALAEEPRLAATKPVKRPSGKTITTYRVRSGDTATALARRSGISVGELAEMNGLDRLDLTEGQKLVLPAGAAPEPSSHENRENTVDLTPPSRHPAAEPPPARRTSPKPNPPATSGTYYHVVKRGETFSSIARDKNVALSALTKANQSVNPAKLAVGQQLNVPGLQVASRGSDADLIDPPTAGRPQSYHFDAAGEGEPSDVPDNQAPSLAYRITARDTPEELAREFNTTPAELRRFNQMGTFDQFTPGSFIKVPWQNPARPD